MYTNENDTVTLARRDLERVGLRGADVHFAELIPAVEMARADGEVDPMEHALLEAYADSLVARLNEESGADLFEAEHGRAVLARLLEQPFGPRERTAALRALAARAPFGTPHGSAKRLRMLEWAEAVGAVSGRPVWHWRERFWLDRLRNMFAVRA